MPTTITPGIASYTDGDFIDEFKVTQKKEIITRRGTTGNITKIHELNPTNDFSSKGGGNPAIGVGVLTLAITGLTGGVKAVPEYGHTEHNNEFDDYDFSGTHYPNAASI